MILLSETLFDREIQVQAQPLDRGIHVLVFGGEQSHVGAISAAEPGAAPETMVFPGHKEEHITEPWAVALAEQVGDRAVVAAGIHYDGLTREQIQEVLCATDRMLAELLKRLAGGAL